MGRVPIVKRSQRPHSEAPSAPTMMRVKTDGTEEREKIHLASEIHIANHIQTEQNQVHEKESENDVKRSI